MYKYNGKWLRRKPNTHLWPPQTCLCGHIHTNVHTHVPPHKGFAKAWHWIPMPCFCVLLIGVTPPNMNFQWLPFIPEWQGTGIMTFPEELTLIPWIRIWRSWHFIPSKHTNSDLRATTGGCSKVSRHMLSIVPSRQTEAPQAFWAPTDKGLGRMGWVSLSWGQTGNFQK